MPRNEHLPARTGCEISPKVGNFDRERLEHHLPKQAQTSAHRALPKRTEERRHEDRNSHRPFRSGTRVRCLRTQWVSELYTDGTGARACGTVRRSPDPVALHGGGADARDCERPVLADEQLRPACDHVRRSDHRQHSALSHFHGASGPSDRGDCRRALDCERPPVSSALVTALPATIRRRRTSGVARVAAELHRAVSVTQSARGEFCRTASYWWRGDKP